MIENTGALKTITFNIAEPCLTTFVATAAVAIAVKIGTAVYFKKRKHKRITCERVII
jgi:hypothetical protein